jgi:hypothetical protein
MDNENTRSWFTFALVVSALAMFLIATPVAAASGTATNKGTLDTTWGLFFAGGLLTGGYAAWRLFPEKSKVIEKIKSI